MTKVKTQNSKSTQTENYDLKIEGNNDIIEFSIKPFILKNIIISFFLILILLFIFISIYFQELTYYINSYIFVSFGQITSFYIIKLLN